MKGIASWPENTETRDVVLYASKEFPTLLLCLVAAADRRDGPAMQQTCKEIRKVATRIDAYRRLTERRWRREKKEYAADEATG